MRAHIISIGTELTCGLTVDTNSAWLARRLGAVGISTASHGTVADEVEAIRDEALRAAAKAEIVLVNGGLGPTEDDLTRQGVAAAAGKALVRHEPSLARIRDYFERLDRPMPLTNERQAYLPEGAEAIENSCGTAPGMFVRIGEAEVYVMPGVPGEMKAMFTRSVEPRLAARAGGATTIIRTLRCFGASEAAIGERIADLMAAGREPTVGITVEQAVISIRIIAHGPNAPAAAAAEADAQTVRDRLGVLVYGEEADTLPSAVAKLLLERSATVVTAESCTGGLLSKMLTDVPGSSAYFLGGFITYADAFKTRFLDVPAKSIARHGAVSENVAAEMAQGCRTKTGVDYALAITGIAGPSGGTADKPVGLVYIGLAGPNGVRVHRYQAGEHLDRESIRERSCKVALNMLRMDLLGESKPD